MALIDSNIWIFAENSNADEYTMARNAIEKYASVEFNINTVTVSETFHKLSKLIGKTESHKRVSHMIDDPNAVWLDITDTIARRAIDLALEVDIRINDALIAQQALEFNLQVLTDNIKDFRKVHGLKIIPLR
jgi:predicted nucleic acid-binding protein